jgi:hypothetical protein
MPGTALTRSGRSQFPTLDADFRPFQPNMERYLKTDYDPSFPTTFSKLPRIRRHKPKSHLTALSISLCSWDSVLRYSKKNDKYCNTFSRHRQIISTVDTVRQLLPKEKVFQALNSISNYAYGDNRPCYNSGGYSLASHRGGPGSSPGQVM